MDRPLKYFSRKPRATFGKRKHNRYDKYKLGELVKIRDELRSKLDVVSFGTRLHTMTFNELRLLEASKNWRT